VGIKYKYAKGRRLEYRVRNFWESQGAFVSRSAKSSFPDLIVITPEETIFVECKASEEVPFDPIKLMTTPEVTQFLSNPGEDL